MIRHGLLALVLVATACSGGGDGTATTGDADAGETTSTGPAASSPAATPTGTVGIPGRGTVDEGLTPFIEQARADLAERLGIDPSIIEVRTAVLVIWPDTSLGCPEPKRQYAQVPTDGSIIELVVEGRSYRYHTGGREGPFLCERPLLRTPATTDADLG